MKKLNSISIFGTSSDSGKSTVTFIIGRILQNLGFTVAPFKAQNFSNNARVADDNSEIAYSQYFQSLVLKTDTSWHNNPILLKSGGVRKASVIVKGKLLNSQDVRNYYRDLKTLKPIVKEGFSYLKKRYDTVLAEGAGSPVELNLMSKDLSNIFIASEFNSKIILVADIEKGGVFASIYGVINLLPKNLRKNVIGVIINKFRGDISLFDKGIKIIEKEFRVPLLGVLPYTPLNLGFEDSASLLNYRQKSRDKNSKKVAIIKYPTISNYNDFEPLILDKNLSIDFIESPNSLKNYDLVILPGSKLVMKDLSWLKKSGFFSELRKREGEILGVCGGYEMMFKKLVDKYGVEGKKRESKGLGFIDDEVVFQKNKIVKKGNYSIFGESIDGFEIHHGVSKKYPLFYEKGNIKGTFVHALFENRKFKKVQEKKIKKFIDKMELHINIKKLKKGLKI